MGVVRPNQKEMSQAENAQGGEAMYQDKKARSVGQPPYYSDIVMPVYKTMNPRYWEYR